MARATRTGARTVGEVGEFALIDRIRALAPREAEGLVLGIGDDAAALRPRAGLLLLATCDIQVEGRHFRRQDISAHELGRRSAAINLSDIAAMGGSPRYALVSLALPNKTEAAWVEELYRGLDEELGRDGAVVIGGNISGIRQQIAIDITLLGEVAEGEMLRRDGARPGDAILVTGSLGMSYLGRRALERGLDRSEPNVARAIQAHRTPVPRVREGRAIAATGKATAMIDVSDGLSGDLGHVCQRSRAGARVHAARLPVSLEAAQVARMLGEDPVDAALHGGEDYELVVTCPPGDAQALAQAVQRDSGTPLAQIGEISAGDGMVLVLPDGSQRSLTPRSWDHYQKKNARKGARS